MQVILGIPEPVGKKLAGRPGTKACFNVDMTGIAHVGEFRPPGPRQRPGLILPHPEIVPARDDESWNVETAFGDRSEAFRSDAA